KAPSANNPTVYPDRALSRRNLVLQLMLQNKLIEKAQYDTAVATQLALNDTLRREDPSGVHFKEQVRRELVERFGKDRVVAGHLKVYSTIDPDMQRAAEDAVTSTLRELDARTKPAPVRKPGPGPRSSGAGPHEPQSG